MGMGLLGFLLTAAQFLVLPFPVGIAAAAFVALAPPGDAPEPFAAGATAIVISAYSAHFTTWKYTKDNYDSQRQDVDAFTIALLGAIDQVSLHALTDPITGTSLLTLAAIFAYLELTFGILTPADLNANNDLLRIPYSPSITIRAYTTQHLHVHALALSNGQPFSEVQKVKALLDGVAPCGLFTDRCNLWKIALPTVTGQTFALLAEALHSWADTTVATTSTLHYTAAATQSPASTSGTASPDLATLIAAAVQAALAEKRRVPKQPRAPKPPPAAPANAYCWTHGARGHTSTLHHPTTNPTGCRHPAAGHKTAATLTNQLGGTPA